MVKAAGFDVVRASGRHSGPGPHVGAGRLSPGGAGIHQQHLHADDAVLEVLNMLAWTIYLSFIGAALLLLLPRRADRMPRILALTTALAGLACGLGGLWESKLGEINTIVRVPWIPSLGIEYHLAADGISLTLVLLTGLAAIAGVLFSWNVERRANEFF